MIKLINDMLDKARRKTMAQLDSTERGILKNKRFVLLQNQEDLEKDALKDLVGIKEHFKELADIHMMKEALRSIYRVAETEFQAETAMQDWCFQATSLHSEYLDKIVKSIRHHWDGIIGFWTYGGLTNASMEGFNNKIRTMIRQAHGFHDEEYMRLKIYDLPNKRALDGI